MKAIKLNPRTKQLRVADVPEPRIAKDTEVKLQILEVGICGTDREEVVGGHALAPPGEEELILGHEAIGKIVEVGKGVRSLKKGDLAAIMCRRGCGKCICCQKGRYDMCYSGQYTERGIKGLHGFQAQYVVDEEQFLIKVPHQLHLYGVLTEPMSVVEKALDELLRIQQIRLPGWESKELFQNKKALVAGLGPIGLLACFALRLLGFSVFGLDVVEAGATRIKILEQLNGTYIDGRKISTSDIPMHCGQIDLILEATGVARVKFDLFNALGINGGYVLTGLSPEATFAINNTCFLHEFVMKNQVAIGSVNASKKHWERAVEDLFAASMKWEKALGALITSRVSYDKVFDLISHPPKDSIKTVVNWSAP